MFAPDTPALSLAELSRRCAMSKPTVHRIVRTLEARQFLERQGDGRYLLGPAVAALGFAAVENRKLNELVMPILHDVAQRTLETVSCTVLVGHEVVTVAAVSGMHRLHYSVFPGERLPASLTADGKVLLAELPHEEVLERLAAEVRMSGRAITKSWLREFERCLADVRATGIAQDLEGEAEPGIACLAVPLRNHRGDTVAALALTVPAARLSDAVLPKAALKDAARRPIPWSPAGGAEPQTRHEPPSRPAG